MQITRPNWFTVTLGLLLMVSPVVLFGAQASRADSKHEWQERNLLYNYSFERPANTRMTDVPRGWLYRVGKKDYYQGQAPGIRRLEFPEKAYEGACSVHFEQSGCVRHMMKTAKVKQGESYRVGCFARVQKAGAAGAKLKIHVFVYEKRAVDGKTRNAYRRSVASEEFDLDSFWSRFSVKYTPRVSQFAISQLMVQYRVEVEGDADVYLDSASFIDATIAVPPPEQISSMEIAVPRIAQAPRIDGTVDEAEWDHCALVEGFAVGITVKSPFLSSRQNRVYLGHDRTNFYVGLQSEIFKGEELRSDKMTERDGPWGDDAYQVFVVLPGSKEALVFNINSVAFADTRYDKAVHDRSFQTTGEVASSRHGRFLDAEMRVPAQELGVAKLSPDTPIRFNALRYETRTNSYALLQPVRSISGPAAQWDQFALLKFRDDARGARLLLGGVTGGEVAVEPRLTGTDWQGEFFFCIYDITNGYYVHDPDTYRLAAGQERAFRKSIPYTTGNRHTVTFKFTTAGGDPLLALSREFRVLPDLLFDYSVDCVKGEIYFELHAKGLRGGKRKGILEVAKEHDPAVLFDTEFAIESGQQLTVTVPLAKLADGDHLVDVRVLDAEGMTGIEMIEKVTLFQKEPYWLGNQYGLDDWVPPPWTPVKYEAGTASVWARKHVFRNSLFPAQIESDGGDLLAAPMQLYVRLAGRDRTRITDFERVGERLTEARAVLERAAEGDGFAVRGRATVAYDGMVLFDFTVQTGESPVRELFLDIPLRNEVADAFFRHPHERQRRRLQFLDRRTFVPMDDSGIGEPTDMCLDWENNKFWCELRLGNLERGLIWFAESEADRYIRGEPKPGPNGWDWVHEGGKYYDIIRNEAATILRVYLVTRPAPKKKLHYVFGVQAYPTRPIPRDHRKYIFVQRGAQKTAEQTWQKNRDGANVCYFDMPARGWRSVLEGRPDIRHHLGVKIFPRPPLPLAPEHDAAHKKEFRNIVEHWCRGDRWLSPHFQSNYSDVDLPAYKYFQKLWENPLQPPFVTRASDHFVDYYTYHFYHYVKRYRVNGVQYDCCLTNPVISEPIGAVLHKEGRTYPMYPLLRTRRMKERIYKILHRLHDEPYVELHGPQAPYLSFATHRLAGEDWRHHPRFYFDKNHPRYDDQVCTHDLRSFRYLYCVNLGPPVSFLPESQYSKEFDIPTVHIFGLVLLHDLYFRPQWIYPPRVPAFMKLRADFGLPTDPSIEFHPYWKPMPEILNENSNVKISYYRKKHGLMVVLCNVEDRVAEDVVQIGMSKFDFPNPQFVLYDPVREERQSIEPTQEGGTAAFAVTIAPTVYKAILVTPEQK